MHRFRLVFLIVLGALSACGHSNPPNAPPSALSAANVLRRPEDFAGIADREERSRAIFVEATRVMFHPRCINCHPAGDSPTQGDDRRLHDPPVTRGPDNHGVVALECMSCHQDKNLELARVPGAPKWALAPTVMAWVNRTPHMLCEQLKDPKRNGDRTLAKIAEHAGHDDLVAWGWAPGRGRSTPPGTQKEFGALVAAWIETGAACPKEKVK